MESVVGSKRGGAEGKEGVEEKGGVKENAVVEGKYGVEGKEGVAQRKVMRRVFLLLRQLPAVARRLGPSCNKTPSLHACLLSRPNLRHGLGGRGNECKKYTDPNAGIRWNSLGSELLYTDSFDPRSLSGVCLE
ncbi:hypothetical protein Pcinc_034378 [Petrolisthes cinctipes]|uniref:Uncharacterized protein n=1 Tax=Petrolisthes cinctipes TaxID=88211 RepID=A0AAE1EQD9_PETCI|nr:hypothetical protein Pcinc_034378 [Petrolisthes cinctipes]